MSEEKKETPQPDLMADFLAAAKIRKCVMIAWFEDGSMRQTVTGMNQMELVGFAEMLKQDALAVGGLLPARNQKEPEGK